MKTARMYILGFGLSLVLTLAAFWMVEQYVSGSSLAFSREALMVFLVLLAVAQLTLQLFCFLHLGEEPKPRWNLTAFIFALIVVGILVGGTLWIMNHLMHEQMNLSQQME